MSTMNRFIPFFLFTILLSLTGCGGSAPAPVKKVELPSWINSPLPSDTENKMYGLGIAKDRKAAINAALNDMVSRLGIAIKSSYTSQQTVDNDYSRLLVKDNISANVSQIKINNYKVIKSYKINYKEFAVMIETDKKKFIDGLKSTLDKNMKNIEQKYNALKEKNIIVQYNEKKKLALESKNLIHIIFILSELDPKFHKDYYLKFVTDKQKAFLNISNRLKFYVSGRKKSAPFVNIIKDYLARKGFSLANSKSNAVDITVSVKDNINFQDIAIAVLTLRIDVYERNKRIGGNTKIIKERYNHSRESVYKTASIHFERDIKEFGINKVIGVQLDN